MKREARIYPAKLLLFGEHTVLKGSSSLAVPFVKYYMKWADKISDHPEWLTKYVDYLQENCHSFLKIEMLDTWIRKNTIVANIPIGYGLGSSGALTAAIYEICKKTISDDNDLSVLQHRLGLMESFFHGKSSGFDPLISLSQSAILKTTERLRLLESQNVVLPSYCYLLDSGQARSGKDMIHQFLANYEDRKETITRLAQANNEAIDSCLNSKSETDFLSIIKRISTLQSEAMSYMILPELMDHWKNGIASNHYYMKVCGAGGGGYYLVFSKKEIEHIGQYKLEKVTLP